MGTGASIKACGIKAQHCYPINGGKVYQGSPVKSNAASVHASSYNSLTFKLYRDDELVMTQAVTQIGAFVCQPVGVHGGILS
ncbi:hypothetical protein [Endozoicomonas sp. ALB032]|uniref:hypothetical protein n=1 Tax=Endozoicomonas sp. ALB032 TaxID=3403082 RepID=UPI003BB69D0E